MTGSSRASDRLDYPPGLNEVVRTVISQELRARYSLPTLVTLVNQLDNQQKKNAKRCLFVVHVALQRRRIYLKTKRKPSLPSELNRCNQEK